MAARNDVLRVAAVQAAPEFLDAPGTAAKAVRLIEEAAAGGARLIAFGEGFLAGHPIWLHVLPVTNPAQIALANRLAASAITIPGPETDLIADAARRTGTHVVMGVVERIGGGSPRLALSALVVDADGTIASRRKLVPAVGERVLFTAGGAESIRTFPTPWGPMSVLLGGENSNPLLTWTLRELGARLHVAAWPPHFNKPGVMGETATITGRSVAYQNTAYVISVAGATTPAIRESLARTPDDRALLDAMAADPASTVYAPRGSLLAGPLAGGEGILYADLALGAGDWPAIVNRHYDRPDLFRVTIERGDPPPPLAFDPPGATRSAPGAPAAAAAEGQGADLEARARALVAGRYGATLPEDDRERLVPFVVGMLRTSAGLAALAAEEGAPDAHEPPGEPRGA